MPERPRIALVIAPEPTRLAALETLVRERGFEPRRSPAVQAGGQVLAETAALVLADVSCGAEPLRALTGSVPRVIAVGARDAAQDVLTAMRAGAADFLPRDARAEELDEILVRSADDGLEATAVLEMADRHGEPRLIAIRGASFGIGRDPANDLCLDSAVVSRFHARIVRRGSAYHVLDSGSRHGTFVDGQRVEDAVLAEGQQLRFGSPGAPVLVFRPAPMAPEPSTRTRAPPQDEPSPSQEMRDIASLFETFLKLNGDLLLEDLLQIVVARSIELADAERGMILLVEGGTAASLGQTTTLTPPPASSSLRLAVARHRDGTPIAAPGLLISHKIPQEVLMTGKGAILEDLLTPDRADVHSSTIQIGVRSAMCVPLRPRRVATQGGEAPRVLGVLYVDSTVRSRPFPERLLHALESLAMEAAQAIFSSRLYQESLLKHEMDAEMRIAQSIQKNLLPPSTYSSPSFELHGSYRASHQVGGDLLDYYPFPDGRVTVVLGDVAGKGVSAALVSAVLDGLCYGISSRLGQARELAPDQDLGAAARDLNLYLVSKPGLERFASVIFGTFWPDGRFTHVNAGHNPPLCLRANGELTQLPSGGRILGVSEDAEYRQEELRLGPADVLVLYSDGVTDARSPQKERFGVERLRACVLAAPRGTATAIHDAILAAVTAFRGGEPAPDDITLMVVRRKPVPSAR